MRIHAQRLLLVLAAVTTIGCDRVTKHAAMAILADESRHSFLADTVRLEYAENLGGFLSMGANWPTTLRTGILTVGTGLMLLALTVAAFRFKFSPFALTGVVLIVAGGASNWFDRVARGSVPDFINIGVGSLRTGIFNVADVAITFGAAMLVLAEFRKVRGPSTTT